MRSGSTRPRLFSFLILFLTHPLSRTHRLRLRHTFEDSAKKMIEENAALKQSSEQLQYDLTMLQETIGAIGDKGDDWLGQLRFLY